VQGGGNVPAFRAGRSARRAGVGGAGGVVRFPVDRAEPHQPHVLERLAPGGRLVEPLDPLQDRRAVARAEPFAHQAQEASGQAL